MCLLLSLMIQVSDGDYLQCVDVFLYVCSHRTATMKAPLLFTSGLVRHEAVLHSCGTSLVGGRVPTCDSAHSWLLDSAASLEHEAAGIMTYYPTQSHYPDTERTSPCPILIMLSARLVSDKYQF